MLERGPLEAPFWANPIELAIFSKKSPQEILPSSF